MLSFSKLFGVVQGNRDNEAQLWLVKRDAIRHGEKLMTPKFDA